MGEEKSAHKIKFRNVPNHCKVKNFVAAFLGVLRFHLPLFALTVSLSGLTFGAAQTQHISKQHPSRVGEVAPYREHERQISPAGQHGVGTTSAGAPTLEPTPANFFTRAGAGLTGVENASSSLGDINNDGHLDLIITGSDGSNETATLYLGDGRGGFTDANAELTGVDDGSSSLGDVNDDGNLDLVVTGSDVNRNETATLYLGDGRGGFTDANAGLTGVYRSSSSLGDVNNDGNLDLVITGYDTSGDYTTTLYLGDGTGGFSKANAGLTGVADGSSSLGDVNNDGHLDLVITGYDDTSGDYTTTLYLGNGQGGFTDANAGLTGVYHGSSSLGDVNNDGNLDLVVTGYDVNRNETATLYLGDGRGGFTDANAELTGVRFGSSSLGDVNNDGHLDLVITGRAPNRDPTATLYLGDGTGGFTDANAGLTGVIYGSSSFRDVDGDGDIDLVVTGRDNLFGRSARVYINRTIQVPPNQFPRFDRALKNDFLAPGETGTFLVEAGDPDGDRLTLTDAGSVPGVSLTDAGNGIAEVKFTPPLNLAGQTVGLLVEARDDVGATTSTSLRVEVGDDFASLAVGLTGVDEGSSSLGDVNSDGNLDLLITGKDVNNYLSTTLYLGDGQGGFTVHDAGLYDSNGSSSFGDINNDGHLDLVIAGVTFVPAFPFGTVGPRATVYLGDGTGGFTEGNAGLNAVRDGSSSLGDVNNDGHLDLVITGLFERTGLATLYLGDGQGGFTDANAGLDGVDFSASSFGDVNNDGNLDLLIIGDPDFGAFVDEKTTLYLGDGQGGFTDANAGLLDTNAWYGSSSLGDVNSDGNLDLVITGFDDNSNKTSTLYLGDGQGGFTDAYAGLTGVSYGSSSLGDVNNDGHLDLVTTGYDPNGNLAATLYLGDGQGGFTEANAGLTSVEDGSLSLGDVNNDGHLDLVITGDDASGNPTATLYENLAPGNLRVAAASQAVSGDGRVDFSGTGASVVFAGTSGSGDVTVQRFANTPRRPLGISEANVSTYRFVVSAPGTLTFGSGTELRLDVGTLGGVDDPSTVTVYTRATRGEGVFRAVPTTYDASAGEDGELVAQVSTFSEFALASDDASNPLPVELSRLTATLEGNDAVLSWQTASETDNAGFEVERRSPSGEWSRIGRVAGAGTTPEPQSYRFRDTALPYTADSLTYRLRQVDLDGTNTLSEEITLTRAAVTDLELLGTYPNPARTRATIRFAVPARADGGEATLQLYDLLGRRVRQVLISGTAGRHEQQLNVSGLSSGLYFLRLVAGGEVRTQRITVVR
jgi:predicted nucleotidyltransferase